MSTSNSDSDKLINTLDNQTKKLAAGTTVGAVAGAIASNSVATPHSARGLAKVGFQTGQAASSALAAGGGLGGAAIAAKGALVASTGLAAPVIVPIAVVGACGLAAVSLYKWLKS